MSHKESKILPFSQNQKRKAAFGASEMDGLLKRKTEEVGRWTVVEVVTEIWLGK